MPVDHMKEFRNLVAEIVVNHPSNGDASRKLLDFLEDDGEMREAIRQRALEEFVKKEVQRMRGKIKADSKKPNKGDDEVSERKRAMRAAQYRAQTEFWDDYTIAGKKLKDADYQLVSSHAHRMEKQAEGTRKVAEFESRVAERMEPGDLVKDCWTLEELEDLRDEIWE